jgi:nucleoside 2-deoxyribosyltransferase
VTSRWLDGTHEARDGNILADEESDLAEDAARQDLQDVDDADVLIFFSEAAVAARGGRHVEFGYALAKSHRTGYPVYVVGPVENIFHRLPGVEVFATWPEALRALEPVEEIARD